MPSELEELTIYFRDYKRDLDRYTTQSVLRSTLTLQKPRTVNPHIETGIAKD